MKLLGMVVLIADEHGDVKTSVGKVQTTAFAMVLARFMADTDRRREMGPRGEIRVWALSGEHVVARGAGTST